MKKFRLVIALIWCSVVCLPVIVIFTEGADGGPTWWNVFGLIYMFLLLKFPKKFFPSCVRTTVDKLVRDE